MWLEVGMHRTVAGIIFLFNPMLVFAHASGANIGGFVSGISHPVLGYDHLLAMISVGALSAQLGGKAIWSVPLTFVVLMLLGGLLGINGVSLISVEIGIAVSVIVLGVALAVNKKIPELLTMLFVGFFALFHGHAHGTEMPNMAQPGFYILGFVLGTATIHLFGVALALGISLLPKGDQVLRLCGVSIACVGTSFLVS